jgi:hypothetical protein
LDVFCTVIDIISVCGRIPVGIPIVWPRAVMVGPRPRLLLTLPLITTHTEIVLNSASSSNKTEADADAVQAALSLKAEHQHPAALGAVCTFTGPQRRNGTPLAATPCCQPLRVSNTQRHALPTHAHIISLRVLLRPDTLHTCHLTDKEIRCCLLSVESGCGGVCGGRSGVGTGFSPSTSGFLCQYHSAIFIRSFIVLAL